MIQNGINKIFDLFDDDHTGFIASANIRRVAKELGETMNVQELEEMLQRAASNGREISREDFYNIMTKKTFWSDMIDWPHFLHTYHILSGETYGGGDDDHLPSPMMSLFILTAFIFHTILFWVTGAILYSFLKNLS